jgi:hypothetical protein
MPRVDHPAGDPAASTDMTHNVVLSPAVLSDEEFTSTSEMC